MLVSQMSTPGRHADEPAPGKAFEDLVASIEWMLAPPGFTVRSSVPKCNAAQGRREAKPDVLIKCVGPDGAVRWLFGCRERPGDPGRVPASLVMAGSWLSVECV